MVHIIFAVLGLVGAAFAQSSAYTGPMFNPSEAPHFGYTSLVIPTLTDGVPTAIQTPTYTPSLVSYGPVSSAAYPSGSASRSAQISFSSSASRLNQTSSAYSSMSSTSAKQSSNATQSSLATSASRTSSVTTSAPVATSSTGAAAVNIPGVVGLIAGGLFAGFAML